MAKSPQRSEKAPENPPANPPGEEGKKKTPPSPRTRTAYTRIRPRLMKQVQCVARLNDTDATQEVNRYVREGLMRENRWPPPDGEGNEE